MIIEAIFVTKVVSMYTGKLYVLRRNRLGQIKWKSTGKYLGKSGEFEPFDMAQAARVRFEYEPAHVLEHVQGFNLPIIVRDISPYSSEEDFLDGDL